MAKRSTRGPSTASTAGRSVSAEVTASPTTIAPAIPTERKTMNSNRISPISPSSTVRPLKNTALPAVATVVATASLMAGSVTRFGFLVAQTAVGQLLAESAGGEQGVVDAEAQPEERRQVQHKDHSGVCWAAR